MWIVPIETEMNSLFQGRGNPRNEQNPGGFCLKGGVMGCVVSFMGISVEQATVRVGQGMLGNVREIFLYARPSMSLRAHSH